MKRVTVFQANVIQTMVQHLEAEEFSEACDEAGVPKPIVPQRMSYDQADRLIGVILQHEKQREGGAPQLQIVGPGEAPPDLRQQ